MRSRFKLCLIAVLILCSGLGLRAFMSGAVAKYGGVALWATLVYFLLLCVAPSLSRGRCFWLCVGISFAVELFQLTSIPRALNDEHAGFALVFGTTFHVLDLPAYVAGAALAVGLDCWTSRRVIE